MDEFRERDDMVEQASYPLYRAKGWLTLVGVMMIVAGIISALFGIFALLGGNVTSSIYRDSYGSAGFLSFLMFLVYGGSGAIYIWLRILLTRTSSSIRTANETGDLYALIDAQEQLKTYFTILGVFVLIAIILVVLSVLVFGGLFFTMLSR